jgi:ribonuclease P protein component
MSSLVHFSFSKKEHLCGNKAISELFARGKRLSTAVDGGGIKCIYEEVAYISEGAGVSKVLISVPKKNLKRAVDRNHIKRLIRESYRHEKHIISNSDIFFNIAFIYNGAADIPYFKVREMVRTILTKIAKNHIKDEANN